MRQKDPNERLADLLMSSFVKRLGAWFVDQAILMSPIVLLLYFNFLGPYPYLEVIQLTVILDVTYFTVLEGSWAQTTGKRLMRILVYNEEGRKVGYKSALLRRIGMIIPIFFLIDALMIFFTSRRQRLFDVIAGTVVVEEKLEADASKFLRGEDIVDSMIERGLIAKAPKKGAERDRRTLEKLQEMRENLEESFEAGEISKDRYLKLRSEYEARIKQLEERLRNAS